MIKTNIKMRVTPEQSAKVQEICFNRGFEWVSGENKAIHINEPFIIISSEKDIRWIGKDRESIFIEAKEEEIDPELFIRTNGSCIEKLTSEYIEKVINEGHKIDNSINNGGKTDYYQLENAAFKINDFDDFAEWRGLNGSQFNMGKVMWTFNTGRHSGTDYERDLNKIIHYANRELLRLKRGEK